MTSDRDGGTHVLVGHPFDNRVATVTYLIHRSRPCGKLNSGKGRWFREGHVAIAAAGFSSRPFAKATFGAAAGFAFVAGCSPRHSVLDPAGPAADAIVNLWWAMLFGSVAIFLLVSAVLVLALAAPSLKAHLSPRRLIVWGGLVMPAAVLTALVVAAFMVGEQLLAQPRGRESLTIDVTARQWSWEFRYPSPDGVARVTTDILHIPAGRDVDFAVRSEDVIHSFWIPRLGGKIDAIPGRTNRIRLRADQPGSYGGLCAEFCGTGHPGMHFSVEAHSDDDYDKVMSAMAAGMSAE